MAFFWLFLHQYGPIRFYNFWPTSVDVPAYLFNTVLIYIVLKNQYKWLLLVAPVAALQHETFMVFTLVLLFYKISSFYFFGNRSSKNKSALIFIGSSCVLMFIAMSLPSLINPQGQGHSFIRIISNLTQILGERYILGTIPLVMVHFFCYAGLLLLALLNFNQSYRNLEWLNVLILFVGINFCMGVIGGPSNRSAFMIYPYMMTLILFTLNGLHPLLVAASLILSLPLMRIFVDFPFVSDPLLERVPVSYFGTLGLYMILTYAVLYYLKTSGILVKFSEIIAKKYKDLPKKIIS